MYRTKSTIEGSQVQKDDIIAWIMPYDIIFGTGTGRKIDEAEENSALSLLSHNGLTLKNHSDIKNFNPEYWKQKLKKRFEHIKTRNNVKRIIGGMKVKVQNSNQNRFNGNEKRSYQGRSNEHRKPYDDRRSTEIIILIHLRILVDQVDSRDGRIISTYSKRYKKNLII